MGWCQGEPPHGVSSCEQCERERVNSLPPSPSSGGGSFETFHFLLITHQGAPCDDCRNIHLIRYFRVPVPQLALKWETVSMSCHNSQQSQRLSSFWRGSQRAEKSIDVCVRDSATLFWALNSPSPRWRRSTSPARPWSLAATASSPFLLLPSSLFLRRL